MLPRTSVVLLLLMIVAELPLTLCRHPTLCLHHVFHFTLATLESLGGVKALHIGTGVHTGCFEVTDGVMTGGHRVHRTGV